MSIPQLYDEITKNLGEAITVLIGDVATGKTTWAAEYAAEHLTTYTLTLDDRTESWVQQILSIRTNTVTIEMTSGEEMPVWLRNYQPRILVFWSDYPNTVVLDARKEDRWSLKR